MTRPTGNRNREPKHTTAEHGALWAALHRAVDWVTAGDLAEASGLHRNTVLKTTTLWAGRGWLHLIPGDHRGRPSRLKLTAHGRSRVPAWLEEDSWCRS